MMGYGASRKLANSPLHFIIIIIMKMGIMRKLLKIMMTKILHKHPLRKGGMAPC